MQALGFAYAAQEIPAVPDSATDMRLDGIVTEAGLSGRIGAHRRGRVAGAATLAILSLTYERYYEVCLPDRNEC